MGRITFTAQAMHEDIIDTVESETDVASQAAAVRECITRYADLKERAADLQKRVDELQQQADRVGDLEAERDDLADEVAELQDERDHLQTELDDREDTIADLQAEIDSLEARNTDLTNQLAEANTRIDAANELVEYVDKQKSAQERWREAGILGKAKYSIFGMSSDDE